MFIVESEDKDPFLILFNLSSEVIAKQKQELIDVEIISVPSPADNIWLTVGDYKLTGEVRSILARPFGWLIDEHVVVTLYLIKAKGSDMGGLNNVTAMTRSRKFRL